MKVIHRAKAKRYKKKAWLQGHPKTGSWHTKRFIHGPRLVQPEKFDSFYLFDREKAEDRHVKVPKSAFARIKKYAQKEDLHLVKNWKEKAKIKVGTKNGELKAQSLLTPIKNRDFKVPFPGGYKEYDEKGVTEWKYVDAPKNTVAVKVQPITVDDPSIRERLKQSRKREAVIDFLRQLQEARQHEAASDIAKEILKASGNR